MRGDAQETVMAKPSAVAREELGRTIRAAMSDAIGSDAGPAAKQHEAEWDALDEEYRERWRVVADAALTFAAARVAEERERALAIVAVEEEMDGPMPDSIWNRCVDRESAAEVMRATVRATKANIASALRAPEGA